ncbi:InlB B-repeat-containing protein [Chloroflexota bacterium]
MEVSPVGSGTVKIDDDFPEAYPADLTVDSGKSVAVVAVPASGYIFSGWSGDLTGTVNPAEISMTCAKKITASFSRTSQPVTLVVQGSGSARLAVGDDASTGEATLVATPDSGWRFNGWIGDVANPKSSTTQINLDAPRTITANFSRVMHNLDINISGRGSASPSVGSHSYAEGETITIVATPDSGWRFDSWTGDVTYIESATVTVPINASKSVTVNFTRVFPIWLLTLVIIVALIGLALYYAIHRGYLVIQRRPAIASPKNRRGNRRR